MSQRGEKILGRIKSSIIWLNWVEKLVLMKLYLMGEN